MGKYTSDYNKSTKSDFYILIIIFIFLFIFNETTRSIFSHNKLNQINIIYAILAFILIVKSILSKQMERKLVFLVFGFTGVTIINTYFQGKNAAYFGLMITTLIIPLFFSTIKVDRGLALKVFDKLLFIYNILCIPLLIFGITDYLVQGKLQLFLANRLFYGEMSLLINIEHSSGIYRFYSFIGHPLTNARYFLLFFSLNAIYNKYNKPKLNILFMAVSTIIGLTLSGSRMAMVLGLFLIVFCSNIKKNKFIYLMVVFFSVIIVSKSSLFQNNLLQRYVQGVNSGDMSSGRNVLLRSLIQNGDYWPSLLLGGGSGYSRDVAEYLMSGINFEYPLIMLAYDYSIIGVMIIYIVIAINPIVHFIKNKNNFILINFIILLLYDNCNNGLANFSDSMAQFCFIVMLFKNISQYNNKELK